MINRTMDPAAGRNIFFLAKSYNPLQIRDKREGCGVMIHIIIISFHKLKYPCRGIFGVGACNKEVRDY